MHPRIRFRGILYVQDASITVLQPSFAWVHDGGARRDRTADLLRAKQALSQLSYGP
jgi:hypothetical protein